MMENLRGWSFMKVLLVSGGWILLCVLVAVGWLALRISGFLAMPSGSGGIGAVSFGVNALVLALPLAPPVVLMTAWLVARWTRPARL